MQQDHAPQGPYAVPASSPTAPPPAAASHDDLLDAAEADLRGVEAALARLDAGTYWTDEVTGAPLPDDVLAQHPTRRTLVPSPPEDGGWAASQD